MGQSIVLESDILDLIKLGEGARLEFKESFSKELRKEIKFTICSFCNTLGGKVLIGVKDGREIVGVDFDNKVLSEIEHIGREINPNIKLKVDYCDEVRVIVIEVFQSSELHSVNGAFFIREGSMTVKLVDPDEVRSLFEIRNKLSFEEGFCDKFSFPNDFVFDKFKNFLKLAKIEGATDSDMLERLGLFKDGKLNNAGALFFCDDVRKFFLQANVSCVLYEGTSGVNILARREFTSDILSNYNDSYEFILSKLNNNYIIKGIDREERLELPKKAIREALVNAFVHRDYWSNSHIQVDIHLDRVEISNPGGLPMSFDRSKFGLLSMARNPLLMGLMLRAGKVEKLGSGVKRIKDEMEDYGLNVDFELDNFFRVVFHRKCVGRKPGKTQAKTRQNAGIKLLEPAKNQPKTSQKPAKKERLEMVIEEIRNGVFTKRGFAEKIGMNKSTVEEDLRDLKENGTIEFVGSKKGGKWEVLK